MPNPGQVVLRLCKANVRLCRQLDDFEANAFQLVAEEVPTTLPLCRSEKGSARTSAPICI